MIGARSEWFESLPSSKEKDAYDSITPKLKPYAHQRKAMNEAVGNLSSVGFHALFMEMGTGKTKTTIDTFMAMVAAGVVNALVVVSPKSLMSTWRDEEIPKHITIDVESLCWDGKATKKSQFSFECFIQSTKPIIYIVNVEAFQSLNDELRRRMSAVLRGRKCLMAVDESSTIKGPKAIRAKNIIAAGKLCIGRMILTGTEMSKGPLDLFMQFEFLKPGFWGMKSFFQFQSKYAILKESYGAGGRTFKKVVGYQKVDEIVSMIEPYTTRALKKDCLDLPEKIRTKIYVELTERQAKMYKQLKDLLVAELDSGDLMLVQNKVALFTKFRQLVGGTMKDGDEYHVVEDKPEKLTALLDDLADYDGQAIIWSAFRGEVQLIAKHLSSLGEVVTFDGSTDIDDRSEAKVAFQQGRARFFVSNMKAGAYGLNLQNCSLQYFYSRDLSPEANWQAEDRSHRPGQTEKCVYKSLIAKGTVDERIMALLEESTDLRDMVRGMSKKDIIDFI